MLPGYEAEAKERGNTTIKWSKAEVVEKAAGYIRALEELKVAGEVAKRVRVTRKQNRSGGGDLCSLVDEHAFTSNVPLT